MFSTFQGTPGSVGELHNRLKNSPECEAKEEIYLDGRLTAMHKGVLLFSPQIDLIRELRKEIGGEIYQSDKFYHAGIETTLFYNPATAEVKSLKHSCENGKSPYCVYERKKRSYKGSVILNAYGLYDCHAVLVREVSTNKIWLEHTTPMQVIFMGERNHPPGYIQLSQTHDEFHNKNCPQGDVEVILVHKDDAYNIDKLRSALSHCNIKKITSFTYNPIDPTGRPGKLLYNVCYDTKNDTLLIVPFSEEIEHAEIKSPFTTNAEHIKGVESVAFQTLSESRYNTGSICNIL